MRRPSDWPPPTASAWGCNPSARATRRRFWQELEAVTGYLAGSRPTAVNLFWALARMKARCGRKPPRAARRPRLHDALLEEARTIHDARPRDVSRHRTAWRRVVAGRRRGADALQCRRAGGLRVRHGLVGPVYRAGSRQTAARVCGRNAAAAAGSAADGVGVGPASTCRPR